MIVDGVSDLMINYTPRDMLTCMAVNRAERPWCLIYLAAALRGSPIVGLGSWTVLIPDGLRPGEIPVDFALILVSTHLILTRNQERIGQVTNMENFYGAMCAVISVP
jgi:hypothetical protein